MAVVVIDVIKPKNQGTFPIVEDVDVLIKASSKRLSEVVATMATQADIEALQTAVNGKASQSDLTALSNTVSGKQNTLTEAQLTACNSGITDELVTQIGTNTTAIAGKADATDLAALNAEVDTKADNADLAAATADLQAQIDALITPVTQDAEVENARITADGTTYNTLKGRLDAQDAAKADADDLDDLSDDVDALASIQKSPNILNPADIQTGKFIATDANDDLEYKTTNPNFSCVLLPVTPGKTYTVTAIGFYVTGFNESLHALRQLVNETTGTNVTFTVPATSTSIKYASVSWNHVSYPENQFMIVEGSTLPTTYKAYNDYDISFSQKSIDDIIDKSGIEDFDQIASVETSPNRLNPADIVVGKFISTDSNDYIKYSENNPNMSCTLFPVEVGKTYTVTGIGFYVTGFSESLYSVRQLVNETTGSTVTFTVPSTSTPIKYASVSWNHNTYPDNRFMIVEGSTLPAFSPYGTIVDFSEKSIEDISKKIENTTNFYVGYGTNDNITYFSSVIACLEAVAETSGQKVVHIKTGTYDLYTELGGREYIESKNTTDDTWKEVQPVISDTTIIGEGKVVFNFKLPNDIDQSHYWLFSALNVHGNFTLENVEIYAENCRYAIHDESNADYPNTERHYKNCVISHVATDSRSNSAAIGNGYSAQTRVDYKDCTITNNNGFAWTCHANAGTSIEFNNVVFINEASTAQTPANTVRVSNNGMYNVPVKAFFSNCFMNNGILVMREEGNDNRDSNTRVDLVNTKLGSLDFQYTTNIYEDVTAYNTLTGVMEKLVEANA